MTDETSDSGDGSGGEGSGSLLALYGLAVLLGLAASGLAWWLQQHEGASTVTPDEVEASPQDADG